MTATTEDTMTTLTNQDFASASHARRSVGYVACNASDGDMLVEVAHGEIRATCQQAQDDARSEGLDGVRYVHTDGYLYVDRPE
jgi:hypothetical protein